MKEITHQGELKIADISIPYYVTGDEIRWLASRQMQVALSLVDQIDGKSASQTSGKRLDRF